MIGADSYPTLYAKTDAELMDYRLRHTIILGALDEVAPAGALVKALDMVQAYSGKILFEDRSANDVPELDDIAPDSLADWIKQRASEARRNIAPTRLSRGTKILDRYRVMDLFVQIKGIRRQQNRNAQREDGDQDDSSAHF